MRRVATVREEGGLPHLAIVIVSYNTAGYLEECLTAVIAQATSLELEIIVVDNNSSDGSVAMVREKFPEVNLLLQHENKGFGHANNIGVQAARAPYVLLLNSDAILLEDTPAALLGYLREHPEVACLGPRINLPDGTRQERVIGNRPTLWRVLMQSVPLGRLLRRPLFTGIDLPSGEEAERDVGWISGVCMLIRREEYVQAGGFDPVFFMYCEDIDLCMKLAQFGTIVHLDDFAVLHYGGMSSPGLEKQQRNAVLQQQNLLRILAREEGRAAEWAARMAIAIGLLLRWCFALFTRRRELRRISGARLAALFTGCRWQAN